MKNPNALRYGGLGVVILLIAFGVFFFSSSKKQEQVTPSLQTVPVEAKKVPSQTTKTYTDDVGFQFDYPDDLIVTKKESTSSASYANLEIESKAVSGAIKFAVEDTKVKSLDEWFSKALFPAVEGLKIKETKLGAITAREIIIGDKITTVALDQGIIFKLDVIPGQEKQYWLNVYNTFLSSFSFVVPQSTSSSTGSNVGEDIILEEEVIE